MALQNERLEILLQDDASTDYDLTKLVGWPPFKVARNPVNLGFIKNVNEAAKRANNDYLLLLNQDCVAINPLWLETMVTLMVSNPQIGIVGPKLVFPDGGGIQSCGGLFDGNKGPFHRYLGWQDITDRRVNTTERVSWITGACLLIRRDDFWRCGGLDDIHYIRGYFDDVDLCMKMRFELGKQVWYCAEATLEHSVGSTGGSKHFAENSRAFHRLWDSKITPDVPAIMVNY